MSTKKTTKNLIVFNGKFLECDSIVELRSGVTEEEWFAVCKGTIEMYCHMRVAKDLGGPTVKGSEAPKISKQDARIMKRLTETIEILKRLDADNLGTLDLETLSKEHVEMIQKEWKSVQSTMKIAHDQAIGDADIYISGM